MKKNYKFPVVCAAFFASSFLTTTNLNAQNIGINSTGAAPAASAGLDVDFTNKGLLIPRVALTATNVAGPVAAPATSLFVYNTATAGVSPNNVLPGYYYWDGAKWVSLGGSGGKDWGILGNAGTAVGTNFLGTTDNNSFALRTNNVERMRVLNTGFVGIGTTAPTYLLQANGDIYANGGWLRASGNQGLFFESWGGGFYMTDATWIRTYNNKNFYHNTGIMRTDGEFHVDNNGARFIVKTNGQTGINSTAPFATDLLSVNNNATFQYASNAYCSTGPLGGAFYGQTTSATNQKGVLWADQGSSVSTASALLGQYLTNGGGNGVYGFTNSNASVGVRGYKPAGGAGWGGVFYNDLGYTGFFGSASDERLKKNIKPIINALYSIEKLNIYSYQFDTEKYPNLGEDNIHFGLMAQQLESVFPNLVKEKNIDLYNTQENVKDKNVDYKPLEKIKTVNYIELIPITIQAIKEQQVIIETQSKRIDELEIMILDLKKSIEK